MSSKEHSASSSFAAGDYHAFAEENQPATWGRPFNEAIETDPSIVGRSITLSGNHSASPFICENCNALAERVAWRINPSNEVRPPNINIWSNHGPFNETSSPYRAPNVTAPHMEFPQPNLQAYGTVPPPQILPVPFIVNPDPSTSCSSFQGLNVFPYAPYCAYYYPTHPYVRYFIPLQNIYASQHPYSFNVLDDLRNKLQKYIEYYFSSTNLETDFYLKSLMDANGWVPISSIAKFRRVQALLNELQLIYNNLRSSIFMQDRMTPLTSNEQFISDSLRSSDDLEMQGDKVRKRHEWEKWVSPQMSPN